MVDLNAELGKAKAAKLGCTFESADVSKRDSWERILARVEQEYGRLDIICPSIVSIALTAQATTRAGRTLRRTR